MKSDIDAAVAQGVPVITVDSDVPNSKRLMFIGTDNHQAEKMMGAKVVADTLKGKGNIVIYADSPGQVNLAERLHGYKEMLDTSPRIKVIETVDMKGDARVSRVRYDHGQPRQVEGGRLSLYLRKPSPVREIAEVLDRKKTTGKVWCMDTDQRTLEAIQKGTITATIGQKPYTMAFIGIKLADDLHHNPLGSATKDWSQDSFSPIESLLDTGATSIDKANVDQFIQERNSATGK